MTKSTNSKVKCRLCTEEAAPLLGKSRVALRAQARRAPCILVSGRGVLRDLGGGIVAFRSCGRWRFEFPEEAIASKESTP